jgi:16S rRNA (guanine966-N2)-methyltransferase
MVLHTLSKFTKKNQNRTILPSKSISNRDLMLRIIGGQFKGRLLKTPQGMNTRPTQSILREALFNICQHIIEGAYLLDIYAGSGAISFEALSRGAAHATLIEKHPSAVSCIEENRKLLGVDKQSTVIKKDAIAALKKLSCPYDIVYIDPPYDTPFEPLIKELISNNLIKEGGIVFIEERVSQKKAPDLSPLVLKNSRRFGIAQLHQYYFEYTRST